ncbi:signal recognition particle subunit SRP68-like [Liolophura sinensis]|uniref:signal recognition particle subunit SRP68-like n=1 Tax=Liolophura sinensis TaxID=3198878 RepID=UPI003159286E
MVDRSMTSESEDVEDGKEEQPQAELFTVEVLQIVKEAQQQHGLRHGDYQRYRSYCSRRIRRIRKSLHFPQGDRRRVQPKVITQELLKDVRYLHLPLFCAERAWGYAMQLKDEANTEHRKKFHMSARLKKAVQYTEELLKLCDSPKCDARTKLEAQAYNSWMKGSLQFESENWKSAIELLSNAKTIYERLASAFTDETQALYLQKVDEVSPSLRYCAYNIGDQSAIQDLKEMRWKAGQDSISSTLDELLSQTREKQAVTLSEVSWRGRTMAVKNEHVRSFLLNIQESEREIEAAQGIDNKVSVYESLIKECIDALQILRDSLQEDQTFRAIQRGQQVDGKISNLHYLHTYLTYLRLTKTVERNLLLIENLKENLPGQQVAPGKKITKPQDLVRLYDIIMQNLGEIPNLSGLEDDEALQKEISTQIQGYKAFRTFYIAQSYAFAKKWPEAIALCEKVLEYSQQALQGYKKHVRDSAKAKEESSSLEELIKQANSLKYSCHASTILDADEVVEQFGDLAIKDKRPLSERLDQYLEDTTLVTKKPNLVPFPPNFEPIPCRPLFFDLALNHIEMPSVKEKMEQTTSRGITGMVKGWLWGGKK